LRALRKRKPQETQAVALASSQSWLPLLRPSIPIGWRLRLLRDEWKPGLYTYIYCFVAAISWIKTDTQINNQTKEEHTQ